MRFTQLISAGLVSVMLLTSTACSQNGGQDGGIRKQDAGTLLGAGGGALLGSQIGRGNGRIVGGVAGGLLGAFLGNQIGQSLDNADMAMYNQTSQRTMETAKTGQTITWKNPDSGNSGTITPTRTYQEGGAYCREYTQTIMVGGQKKEGYGTACRQPDGTWKVQS